MKTALLLSGSYNDPISRLIDALRNLIFESYVCVWCFHFVLKKNVKSITCPYCLEK